MNRKNALILACAIALAVVFVVIVTVVIKPGAHTADTTGGETVFVRQDTLAAEKEAEEAARKQEQPAHQPLAFLPYGSGLYSIATKTYESAQLAAQFPFIAERLKPVPVDYLNHEEGMYDTDLPPYVNVAAISIPSKNLDMIALSMTPASGACLRGFCPFSLYIKRGDTYQAYITDMTTEQNYLLVDNASVSLVMCSRLKKQYRQWRLPDGGLDRPIPANSPGYFVPVGAFVHDKIPATCP